MSKRYIGAVAALAAGLLLAIGAVTGAAGATQTYLVVYKGSAVPADAAAAIQKAGGTLVYAYPEIGVAVASSGNASFRDALLKDTKVDDASATAGLGYQLPNEDTTVDAGGPPAGNLANAPAGDADSLSSLQWDMRQIKTLEAHAITGGSPAVLVGDIDTGIDFNHPDLKANIDVANSANCVSGTPVPGVAAQDDNGHGTHTAGTIAAASNGFGIVGVAPNVHIAAIKAGNAGGFFFPEAVVCAFVWAGSHHMDVTNNSYFADPFLFNCKNDPTQRAIWKAEQRSILYAEQQGVTVVAAEGNESEDTAHPSQDRTSPDNTTPVARTVHNDCVIVPTEVPGVIGVTAVGHNRQLGPDGQPDGYLKSYYSSFGVGVTQLAAPGGDARFGTSPEAPNGRVLSTWPAALISGCLLSRRVIEAGPPLGVYCYQQGTSMASPHVAGVAALVISRYGKMAPGRVNAYLTQTADPQPCPGSLPTTNPVTGGAYTDTLGLNDLKVQSCQGGRGYNSWYGHGQVDAFNAVTHTGG